MGGISAYKGHVSRTQCSMRSANQLELLVRLQLELTNSGTRYLGSMIRPANRTAPVVRSAMKNRKG
jgi:hypothetical protein